MSIGSISGTVYDPVQGFHPPATVYADEIGGLPVDADLGQAATNAGGYEIDNLSAPSSYTVYVDAYDYTLQIADDIPVDAGQITEVDFPNLTYAGAISGTVHDRQVPPGAIPGESLRAGDWRQTGPTRLELAASGVTGRPPVRTRAPSIPGR